MMPTMTLPAARAGLCLALLLPWGSAPAVAAEPGVPAELSAVPGWIVFDSRREGQFDIYKMKADGSRVTRLTSTAEWETSPDWSADGRRIVYARKEAGDDDAASDVWTMNADGSSARLLVKNGMAPQFTPDGRGVIFDRDRTRILRYDMATGVIRPLTPPPGGPSFNFHMVKPRLSAGGEMVAFTSDKGGKWHSFVMDMKGADVLIGSGCEPVWDPSGRRVFFINAPPRGETEIWAYDWPAGPARRFLAMDGVYRHVYFPTVSDDGRYLLFSACPDTQHDHMSAHYQIHIKKLDGGEAVRLSRNEFTDRWPRLCTAAR